VFSLSSFFVSEKTPGSAMLRAFFVDPSAGCFARAVR